MLGGAACHSNPLSIMNSGGTKNEGFLSARQFVICQSKRDLALKTGGRPDDQADNQNGRCRRD